MPDPVSSVKLERPICPHGQSASSKQAIQSDLPSRPKQKLTGGFFLKDEDTSGVGMKLLGIILRMFGG